MDEHTINDDTDLDWQNRILCSDGNCIGVIGPDSRCKECGRPFTGQLPDDLQSAQTAVAHDPVEPDADESGAADAHQDNAWEQHEPDDHSDDHDDEWVQRRLCSDGNCIGVIGDDDLCKECGKPFNNEVT